MGNRIAEASIVRSIMRLLNDLPHTRARKRRGGMANAGEPDIEACIEGLHFEFEVKGPRGRLTPLQKVKLIQWKQAGAVAGRVDSKVEVMKMICQGIRDFIHTNKINDLIVIEEILSAKLRQIERLKKK